MSEFQGYAKMIVVPEQYKYMRIRAAIAHDQLDVVEAKGRWWVEALGMSPQCVMLLKDTTNAYVVDAPRFSFWIDEFEKYEPMLHPGIVFSWMIPSDVMIVSSRSRF